MSTIAVVIPFYEDQATLGEALASAAAQDVPAEVVVVDDGSADPAALVALERAREDGVTVLHQDNQGPAPARMAGVRATEADYVLPLDADDRLLPGALARCARCSTPTRARPRRGAPAALRRRRLRPAQPALARSLAADLPRTRCR